MMNIAAGSWFVAGEELAPLPSSTALLLIDVQKGFDAPEWGRRNNPHMEERIATLLGSFRACGRTVFHAKHMSTSVDSPLFPDHPGNAFKFAALPRGDERVIEKRVNSCFIGTPLEAELRRGGYDTLVIAGMTTNHCVSTTVRMAANLGFRAILASDATATFDRVGPDGVTYEAERIQSVTLADLHDEFAKVVETRAVVEAMRDARHPAERAW
jgi:nicotinamidase-related amidase